MRRKKGKNKINEIPKKEVIENRVEKKVLLIRFQ